MQRWKHAAEAASSPVQCENRRTTGADPQKKAATVLRSATQRGNFLSLRTVSLEIWGSPTPNKQSCHPLHIWISSRKTAKISETLDKECTISICQGKHLGSGKTSLEIHGNPLSHMEHWSKSLLVQHLTKPHWPSMPKVEVNAWQGTEKQQNYVNQSRCPKFSKWPRFTDLELTLWQARCDAQRLWTQVRVSSLVLNIVHCKTNRFKLIMETYAEYINLSNLHGPQNCRVCHCQ